MRSKGNNMWSIQIEKTQKHVKKTTGRNGEGNRHTWKDFESEGRKVGRQMEALKMVRDDDDDDDNNNNNNNNLMIHFVFLKPPLFFSRSLAVMMVFGTSFNFMSNMRRQTR